MPDPTRLIDLNADLGEGFGDYRIADDDALMSIVSSANVACGFHAGDAVTMSASVTRAKALGVDLGAHVGFPDLMGFGRRRMQIDSDTLSKYVIYQLGALAGFARVANYPLTHMSFHGALGNMAAEDPALAMPLLQAVKAFDAHLIISTTAGNAVERCARQLNLAVACTLLADRAYHRDGMLVSRARLVPSNNNDVWRLGPATCGWRGAGTGAASPERLSSRQAPGGRAGPGGPGLRRG